MANDYRARQVGRRVSGGVLHVRPGQRLEARVLERDGYPVVKLAVQGKATDVDALRQGARAARHEPWADWGGDVDPLCALAGSRKGDRLIVHLNKRGRANRWLVVHRLRGGVLKYVAVVYGRSLFDVKGSISLVETHAPAMLMARPKAPPVRLQRPGVVLSKRVPLELRLAPGSAVRLPCPRPANG